MNEIEKAIKAISDIYSEYLSSETDMVNLSPYDQALLDVHTVLEQALQAQAERDNPRPLISRNQTNKYNGGVAIMKLKKGRRFGLSYEKQLKIYATCLNYANEPLIMQNKISRLCRQCGGEHYNALFEAVTTDMRNLDVALKHYIAESTLCRLIEGLYKSW